MATPIDDDSSPLIGVGPKVTRSVSYTPRLEPYVLRFTPVSLEDPNIYVYQFEDIVQEFIRKNDFDIYVLTKEVSSKGVQHYHLYLETEIFHEPLKKLVREFVYPFYPNRTRGFGNKNYNCQISLNPLNAIIYNLKQVGQTEWSGFDELFIDECRKMAFEKRETDFEKDLHILTESFISDLSITPVQFGSDVALLYSKYDKRVHWKDIQGYTTSKLIKRQPTLAYSLANKYLTF